MWYTNMKNKHKKNALLNKIENIIYVIIKKEEIINYFSQSTRNPVSKTCIKDTKDNYFTKCTGLTYELVPKHLQPYIKTTKRKQRVARKNV